VVGGAVVTTVVGGAVAVAVWVMVTGGAVVVVVTLHPDASPVIKSPASRAKVTFLSIPVNSFSPLYLSILSLFILYKEVRLIF
jgi:hypothetical protein